MAPAQGPRHRHASLSRKIAAIGFAFVVGAILSGNAHAQAPQQKSRPALQGASPICMWMLVIESREYRQRCGPPVNEANQQNAERALQILDAYFREHGVPPEMNAAYLKNMRLDWDNGGRDHRCDNPGLGALAKAFDRFTRPEFADGLANDLRQTSGPNDGGCL